MGTNSKFPDTGIHLIADNAAGYIRDVNQAASATLRFQSVLPQSIGALKQVSTLSIAAGTAIGQFLYSGVVAATGALEKLGTQAFDTAARFQVLKESAALMGKEQGFTTAETEDMIKAVRKMGITAGVAADTVSQFARYQIDMTKASELARTAQDAAILANADSSQTLQRLIYGIITQQTEVIRTAGLNVQFADSFKKMADEIGVSTEQLTSAQRVQAALNAVLEEGTKIDGLYEASMRLVGKQLKSFPRYFDDIFVALGTPFLDAASNVVFSAAGMLKKIRAVVDEGGAFNSILMKMGAAADYFTGKLATAADNGFNSLLEFVTGGAKKFEDLALKAFEWGFNISAELGLGIAQGATEVIVQAMNSIINLLSFWLAPGSPPRVAPEIDKWGALAMTEFLKGFSDADYSALNDIQSILQSSLSALSASGLIDKSKTGDIFADLSEGLIRGFDKNNITNIVKQIRSQLGPFGDEVADLTIKEYKLAQATTAVEKAEESLASAQEKQQTAVENMDSALEEYNALVMSGASKEVLAAKRAEFFAARDNVAAANDEVDAAEDQVKKAKKNQTSIEKEVKLQRQLVQQLIELTQARTDEAEAEKASSGGGLSGLGAGIGEAVEKLREQAGSLKLTFDQQMYALKQSFSKKIKEMFEPFSAEFKKVQDQWDEEVLPKWDESLSLFDQYWHKWSDPLGESIKGFAESAGTDMESLGETVGELGVKFLLLGTNMYPFIIGWPFVATGLTNLFVIGGWVAEVLRQVGWEMTLAGGPMAWLTGKMEDANDALGTLLAGFFKFVMDALGVTQWLRNIKEGFSTLHTWLDKVGKVVSDVNRALEEDFINATQKVLDAISQLILDITGDKGLFQTMVDFGKNLLRGIIEGLRDSATLEELRKVLIGIGGMIPGLLKDETEEESPSKVTSRIGAYATEGLALGLTDEIPLLERSIASLANLMTVKTAYAADAMAASTYNRSYITNISNSPDYNLSVTTQESSGNVVRTFELMKLLGGA